MKEDVINIMNSVHIDVVGDKVKIECEPKRDSLPINVVEEIVKATIKQCENKRNENIPEELVKEIAKEYDQHLFKLVRTWKVIAFILAIFCVFLVFWR